MRKSISLILCIALLSCLSIKLYSQSPLQDLDQLELMKQFMGNWAAEAGKDSTWSWKIIPADKDYVHYLRLKVKGNTVETRRGTILFSDEYRKITFLTSYEDDNVQRDVGGFVSDNKYVAERFYPFQDEKTSVGTWECTFLTPDKFTASWIVEGVKIGEFTYIRVKE